MYYDGTLVTSNYFEEDKHGKEGREKSYKEGCS
jgi:hypothetical protein